MGAGATVAAGGGGETVTGAGAGVTADGGAKLCVTGAAGWGAAGWTGAGLTATGGLVTACCGAGVKALVSWPAEDAALASRAVRLCATGAMTERACSGLATRVTGAGDAGVGAISAT